MRHYSAIEIGELSPLRPSEFFGLRWSGPGEWAPRPLSRRLPIGPRRFEFDSSTTPLADDVWLVHDTITWENGRVERRDGVARLLEDDRIQMTYDDMPGGTEVHLRADGFSLSPYRLVITVPVLPVPLVIHAHDNCHWDPAAGELTDTIRISVLGIRIGELSMRLRPEQPSTFSEA